MQKSIYKNEILHLLTILVAWNHTDYKTNTTPETSDDKQVFANQIFTPAYLQHRLLTIGTPK